MSHNLADTDTAKRFVGYLERCERAMRMNGRLTDWERNFVNDLRDHFDGREDQIDLGMTPWNPTGSQWNTLHGIWSKV